jgi:hypothetical protein
MNEPAIALYRPHELAFRTQYAEAKERARSAARLLPGTPGTLVKRTGTGRAYWYRVYRSAAGAQLEELVGKDGDAATLREARAELAFAQWMAEQVRACASWSSRWPTRPSPACSSSCTTEVCPVPDCAWSERSPTWPG